MKSLPGILMFSSFGNSALQQKAGKFVLRELIMTMCSRGTPDVFKDQSSTGCERNDRTNGVKDFHDTM